MRADVLIVDDRLSAAQEFERLVARTTGLTVVSTDDPDHALELMRSGPPAVVVLDQRMPKKTGTVLFAEMRRIDARVRGIMLSGQASGDEAGRAIRDGYADYLHKRDVRQLAGRVLDQYVSYQATLAADRSAAQTELVLLTEQRGRRPFGRQTVEYRLAHLTSIGTEVVRPETWQTVLTLNAGEVRRDLVRREQVDEVYFARETLERLRTEVGLTKAGLTAIRAGLVAEIATRETDAVLHRTTETMSTEATYSLPAEPDDIEQRHIRTRHYQRAPAWSLFHATIRVDCSCCRHAAFFVIPLYRHDGLIATQHVDRYSDGESRTVDTGLIRHMP